MLYMYIRMRIYNIIIYIYIYIGKPPFRIKSTHEPIYCVSLTFISSGVGVYMHCANLPIRVVKIRPLRLSIVLGCLGRGVSYPPTRTKPLIDFPVRRKEAYIYTSHGELGRRRARY